MKSDASSQSLADNITPPQRDSDDYPQINIRSPRRVNPDSDSYFKTEGLFMQQLKLDDINAGELNFDDAKELEDNQQQTTQEHGFIRSPQLSAIKEPALDDQTFDHRFGPCTDFILGFILGLFFGLVSLLAFICLRSRKFVIGVSVGIIFCTLIITGVLVGIMVSYVLALQRYRD